MISILKILIIKVFGFIVTGHTPSCATFTNLTLPVAMTTDVVMTRTLCIQFCKGKNITYALVRNDVCLCFNALSSHVPHANDVCSTSCPGSLFQYCGGPTSDQFSIIEGLVFVD